MSLGKDSIQKRVAKPVQAPAQAKTPAQSKAPAAKAASPKQSTTKTSVVTKISPEVVKKVTGHEEQTGFEKICLGKDLPPHLL